MPILSKIKNCLKEQPERSYMKLNSSNTSRFDFQNKLSDLGAKISTINEVSLIGKVENFYTISYNSIS